MPDEYQMFRNNHKNHGNDHLNNRSCRLPYGKDPQDSNIRIAPSYPTPEELKTATEIFVLSVKLVSIDKILEDK